MDRKGTINYLLKEMKKKIYVVWAGREPGIYSSWSDCEKQVKGFAGARYKSFPTMQEAEKAYEDGPLKSTPSAPRIAKTPASTVPKPQYPYLAVDAACSGNPGKMEFRAMVADTGAEAFHRGPYEEGTNNVGEFLAIVLGLIWLQQQHLDWPIYSDSRTALSWLKKKHAATKLQPTDKNAPIFESLRIAENWLQQHTYTTQVLHWDTLHWGEIPADFGRK